MKKRRKGKEENDQKRKELLKKLAQWRKEMGI